MADSITNRINPREIADQSAGEFIRQLHRAHKKDKPAADSNALLEDLAFGIVNLALVREAIQVQLLETKGICLIWIPSVLAHGSEYLNDLLLIAAEQIACAKLGVDTVMGIEISLPDDVDDWQLKMFLSPEAFARLT